MAPKVTQNFEVQLSDVWGEGSQGKMWMSGGRVWGPGPEEEEFGEQLASLPTSYSLFSFLSTLLNISRRMAQIIFNSSHTPAKSPFLQREIRPSTSS